MSKEPEIVDVIDLYLERDSGEVATDTESSIKSDVDLHKALKAVVGEGTRPKGETSWHAIYGQGEGNLIDLRSGLSESGKQRARVRVTGPGKEGIVRTLGRNFDKHPDLKKYNREIHRF